MAAPAAVAVAVTKSSLVKRALKIAAYVLCFGVAALVVVLPGAVAVVIAAVTPVSAPVDGGPLIAGDWGAPSAGYVITDRFGLRDTAGCAVCSTNHRGMDLNAGCGAPVYSAGPGTVIAAGPMGTYGNRVEIDHGGGVTTLYAHMPDGGITVRDGDTVMAGTRIGTEGTTGNSSGCHLHFEVRISGTAIDPEPFMYARGISL